MYIRDQDWQWELPAGMIEKNLTPLEAAKKELKEETGYTSQNWISLGSFLPSPGSTNERIHLFAALDLEPGRQQLEASEQIHVHLLKWETLMDIVKRGGISTRSSNGCYFEVYGAVVTMT
jgi:ADP-ribose pyrophosphatase